MLSKITLQLVRNAHFPEGSSAIGYEFLAPLDDSGHINADAWRKERLSCTVKHFDPDAEDNHGFLVHRLGGSWAFHYEGEPLTEHEASGYRLSTHCFRPGEYISIQEENNEMLTYRVASVLPAALAKITQHAAWPREKWII